MAGDIFLGAVPTITFAFDVLELDVSTVSKAVITLKTGSKQIDKTTVVIDTALNTISATFTQADTLTLLEDEDAEIQCKGLLTGGVTFMTEKVYTTVYDALYKVAIS